MPADWDEQPVRPDMIMLPSLQEEKDEDNPLPEEEDYEDGNTVSDYTTDLSPGR